MPTSSPRSRSRRCKISRPISSSSRRTSTGKVRTPRCDVADFGQSSRASRVPRNASSTAGGATSIDLTFAAAIRIAAVAHSLSSIRAYSAVLCAPTRCSHAPRQFIARFALLLRSPAARLSACPLLLCVSCGYARRRLIERSSARAERIAERRRLAVQRARAPSVQAPATVARDEWRTRVSVAQFPRDQSERSLDA